MDNLLFGLNISTLTVILIGMVIILCVLVIYFYLALTKMLQRYNALMTNMQGKNLEELFLARLGDLQTAKKDIAMLDERYGKITSQLSHCVQKVGVVRFNAFDDTGSDLSFAIALLDEKNNGVSISSIYGRSEARCYAKPVNEGKSGYTLSEEEKRAIELSKKF